jgi:hypothetical protein
MAGISCRERTQETQWSYCIRTSLAWMASPTQMHNVLCRYVTIEARFTASSRSSGSHRDWTDLYRASNIRVEERCGRRTIYRMLPGQGTCWSRELTEETTTFIRSADILFLKSSNCHKRKVKSAGLCPSPSVPETIPISVALSDLEHYSPWWDAGPSQATSLVINRTHLYFWVEIRDTEKQNVTRSLPVRGPATLPLNHTALPSCHKVCPSSPSLYSASEKINSKKFHFQNHSYPHS